MAAVMFPGVLAVAVGAAGTSVFDATGTGVSVTRISSVADGGASGVAVAACVGTGLGDTDGVLNRRARSNRQWWDQNWKRIEVQRWVPDHQSFQNPPGAPIDLNGDPVPIGALPDGEHFCAIRQPCDGSIALIRAYPDGQFKDGDASATGWWRQQRGSNCRRWAKSRAGGSW